MPGDLIICDERICAKVMDAALAIHQGLGPGLLESIYREALRIELVELGLYVESEVPVSPSWRGRTLGVGFRLDLLIERQLILEVKAVASLLPIHSAQLLTYLKIMRIKR